MIRRWVHDVAMLIVPAALAAVAGGCNMMARVADIGDYPQMTQITNPQSQPGYKPVSLPMPAPQVPDDNPNSLWRPGARAFFKDIRAKDVGDTLTIRLKLDDSAKMSNNTKRKRDDKEAMGVDGAAWLRGAARQIPAPRSRQYQPVRLRHQEQHRR